MDCIIMQVIILVSTYAIRLLVYLHKYNNNNTVTPI